MTDPEEAPPSSVFDPAMQTEKIAFDAEDMVVCRGCGRKNPPNRFKCLYCAKDLETPAATGVKPVIRKLELWEKGYNVVLIGRLTDADAANASHLLDTDVETFAKMRPSMPLARVESEREAEHITASLRPLGFECAVVADIALNADRPPTRLRHIEFADGILIFRDFNTGDSISVGPAELTLAVFGRLFSARVDTTEKRGRKGKSTLVDETETESDEFVLDIYRRGDLTGWRITHAGFDYSGLGAEKSLLVGENLSRLIDRLKSVASGLAVVDDYDEVRHLLGSVWELESRKDPQGLRRTGHRVEFGTVSTTSNANQFTRYSRLQQYLHEKAAS
jgi:hypothetical protein